MKRYEVTAKRREGYPGVGVNGRYYTTGIPVVVSEDEMGGEFDVYAHLLEIRELPEDTPAVVEVETPVELIAKTTPKRRRRK